MNGGEESADDRKTSAPAFLVHAAGVATAWLVLFWLNDVLFAAVEVDAFTSWVFLPAAIRVLAVMLFGWAGIAGLFLGSCITIGPEVQSNWAHAGAISLVSALAPLIAVRTCQGWLKLPDTLAGLNPRNLLLFALAGAATSVALHQFAFLLFDTRDDVLEGVVPMFVGDLIGTALVLFAASCAVRLVDQVTTRGSR